MSRPKDLYRNIKTPFKLEVCRNIDSSCCNQVSSSMKQPLSQPSFLVAKTSSSASFLSQQTFPCYRSQCRDPVCSIVTYIHPSVQHYVATQTILFPADLHMFFPFSVATCCLLSRLSSIVNNQIMVLRHGFFGNCLEVCRDPEISVTT